MPSRPLMGEGIHFTQSKGGKTLYALGLEIPKRGLVTVKSLSNNPEHWLGRVGNLRRRETQTQSW